MEGNLITVTKRIAATAVIILGLFALYNNFSWFMRYIYDPYLVTSVIKVESNFSPKVVSKQGAVGLMQLMPKTALWAAEKMGIKNIKVEDLQNPDLNIRIGTWYLSSLLDEFNNDVTLALAAYNGGRGNVAEWIEKGRLEQKKEEGIPFPETRNFVARVKKSYKWYKRLYKL